MLRYVLTFLALLALTTLTFWLSFRELGPWSVPAAISIALAKAALIALFFMHLLEHRTSSWVAFATGVLLAGTLIGFSFLDLVSRHPPSIEATATVVESPLGRPRADAADRRR